MRDRNDGPSSGGYSVGCVRRNEQTVIVGAVGNAKQGGQVPQTVCADRISLRRRAAIVQAVQQRVCKRLCFTQVGNRPTFACTRACGDQVTRLIVGQIGILVPTQPFKIVQRIGDNVRAAIIVTGEGSK